MVGFERSNMSDVVLSELNRRVRTAGEVLAQVPSRDGARRAIHELGVVDRLLTSMLTTDALPAGMIVCLRSVSHELSRHVAEPRYLDDDAAVVRTFARLQRALLSADIAIRPINSVAARD